MERPVRFLEIGSPEWIKYKLQKDGYVVVPDVLTAEEVTDYKAMFFQLLAKNTQLHAQHTQNDPHGIFKRGPWAHSLMRAHILTHPKVKQCFEVLHGTANLVASQDGCGYIAPEDKAQAKSVWTHVDQAPNSFEKVVDESTYTVQQEYENGKKCVQGMVTLTSNKTRTFRVYPGSHLRTRKWMMETGLTGSMNWHKVGREYLELYPYINVEIPAGSVVMWDSRVWHQSTNECPGEERLVVYVCYLPREHPDNTKLQSEKRLEYFQKKRTTSHWPYRVHVNGEQPNTYGNKELLVDYAQVVYDELLPELEEKYLELLR
jgi:ectoine hydroxylase-related dioxygenase (phytanoyl-CoA dioxygenase family)